MGSVAVTAVKGSIRAAEVIGADVGRLAIDAAEGAIHAADRITAAAGRAANNLIDTTMSGVAGIVSRPELRDSATEPGRRTLEGYRQSRSVPEADRRTDMADRELLPGKFVWFEHVSTGAKKAQAFYGEVFGWKVAPFPMAPPPTR
jgi:hypothetical protein